MAGQDFVNVRLSAAAVEFAGEGKQIAIHNSRREFLFKAGEAQPVLKAYEWSKLLGPMRVPGTTDAMFEIAEEAAAAQPAAVKG